MPAYLRPLGCMHGAGALGVRSRIVQRHAMCHRSGRTAHLRPPVNIGVGIVCRVLLQSCATASRTIVVTRDTKLAAASTKPLACTPIDNAASIGARRSRAALVGDACLLCASWDTGGACAASVRAAGRQGATARQALLEHARILATIGMHARRGCSRVRSRIVQRHARCHSSGRTAQARPY